MKGIHYIDLSKGKTTYWPYTFYPPTPEGRVKIIISFNASYLCQCSCPFHDFGSNTIVTVVCLLLQMHVMVCILIVHSILFECCHFGMFIVHVVIGIL